VVIVDSRNFVTDIPNQINKQIQQNTQKYDVNTVGVSEVISDGLDPITITELGNSHDEQVRPEAPTIRYSKSFEEGKPVIMFMVDFNWKDELGNDIDAIVRCDIFRDKDNNGFFDSDEIIGTIDLKKTNVFYDRAAPKDETVRYRVLAKNMTNGKQRWSIPLIIDTSDTIIPYTPVAPISITNGASTIDEKDNTVTTMLKIEKHASDRLKHMELYFKHKDQSNWSQAIILDEKTEIIIETVEGNQTQYYVYYLTGLSRGQIYSVRAKAIMKTGVKSEYSSTHDFIAGDFVAPAPPREVKAVSICDTTALKVETTWKAALELYDAKDVVKYQLYRLRWVPAAGAFSDMPELVTEITIDQSIEKELYTYTHTLDSSDENKWYVYMVRSVDSFDNYSAHVYSELIQAIREIDSTNIWIDWTGTEDNNFPMRVIWKYTIPSTGFGQSYGVNFIRNTDNSILAYFRVADDSTKKITYEGETGCTYLDLTIDMFSEEAVKEFLAIPNWQTSDNYGVRITASLFNIGGQYSTKAISNYDGQETFLINPRPLAVTGFTAAYSNVDHQVKFKWNKNTFSSLTGYVLKQITGSDYTNLMAHQADTAEDRTIRLAVWNGGTIIADDKVLKKDVTTYNYKLTETINPASPTELFFLIKPVGNFLNTAKYSDLNTRKIYSDEAADASTMLSSILPAPENYSALHYNTEMKVDWTHEYEFRNDENEIIYPEIAKGKLKEFVVYMSTTASDLAVDIPKDKYKVYSGVKSVTVFSDYLNPANPTTRLNIQRGVTYYFKIIPFDAYGYRGTSTPVFASTSLAVPSNLPQPRIIGASKPRIVSLPFGDVSWAQSGTISVDVYNNRNFQVEVGDALSGTFVKDRNVDRIKFYWLINKTFTYISGMDLLLPLSSNEISQQITMKSVRKSFALPTDKTIFRIVAVQARGDVEEGSLTQALPTNYSIIDTQAPSLDITKVVYASDGTNAINKNNYVNKKILTSGIDIYFNAYEKEPNSQIQKVEYSLTEDSWTTATLADGKFNVTNAQIGADTDSNSKYRDIQILVRAYDNADNTCDRAIVFRKDTVGPSASDLPTGLTWAFGKTLKLSWTNPEKQDRNLFDGLKLFVGSVLNTAKEYNLDSSPFELIPDGAVIAGKTVYLFLAATDIADNLTYLDKSGAIQPNQSSPTAIEIINVPPAAPVDVLVESQVGGVNVNWPSVTTDEDGNAEEVKKYVVEYSLAESSPTIWVSPNVDETYTTNINIPLSATELDQFTANTALRLYVRVKAVDYWGAESQWSIYTNSYVRPKNITAVDMGNNIFKFNLTSDMTLTPYVGAVQTGTKEHILDANYLDSEYVSFTINNTTNNYLKIDLNKVEWISDIKLKFKHSTSNVRFVFKIEEVTASGTQDIWLQSASISNHTFNETNEIVITSSKPDPNRYFEYSTTDSGVGDIALFHYENFTTKKAILAKSISIYFYSANATTVNMVEFQPVITSIANIFYGSEINLDYMVSIRSKADLTNYAYLDKYGLGIYGSSALKATVGRFYNGSAYVYGAWLSDNVYIGGSSPANAIIKIVSDLPTVSVGGLSANSTSASISGSAGTFSTGSGLTTTYINANASSASIGNTTASQINATNSLTEMQQMNDVGWAKFTNAYLAFGTGSTYGSNMKAAFGKLATGLYGSWMSNGVYIGGTSYTNADLRLTAAGSGLIELGYISADVYNTKITSSTIEMQRKSDGTYSFVIGSIAGDPYMAMGKTSTAYYNLWVNQTYVCLGHVSSGYYNTQIESGKILLGYHASGYAAIIDADGIRMKLPSESNYNLNIASGYIGLGYTGGYYNTKITSGALYLGHLSGGTSYAMTMDYSGAEATRYFSIKGVTLAEFFRVGRVTYGAYTRDIVWAPKIHIGKDYTTAMTIPGLIDAGISIKMYNTDNLFGIGICGSAILGGSAIRIDTTCLGMEIDTDTYQSINAYSTHSSATIYGNNAHATSGSGVMGVSLNNIGVYGSCYYGYGVYAHSTTGYGLYAYSTNSYAIYATGTTTGATIYGENTNGSGYGIGIKGLSTYNIGVYGECSYGGSGVWGYNSQYGPGVKAFSVDGYGLSAASTSNYGIYSTSTNNTAIYGKTTASVSTPAIHGTHDAAGIGVRGDSSGTAIYGESSGAGNGVRGHANSGYGGVFSGATALYTSGPVKFTNLSADGTGSDLVIDDGGIVRKKSSALRKKDILSYVSDYSMDKFNSLIAYNYRFKESGHYDLGYIAEDIEKIFPALVVYNNEGKPESLKYDRFCVYNVLATQEHDRIIKQQRNEIIALKNEINEIKNLLQTLLQ